jgi:VWFA-related protein
MRFAGGLAALAIGSLLAATAPAAAQQPAATFGEETSVVLVEVPVEVWRDGKPVTGLTQADFEVKERGRALRIVGFDQAEVGVSAAAEAKPEGVVAPPLAARRHVFLLYDLAFSRRERVRDGLAAGRRMLAAGLDGSDLVAVGAYTPRGELPILLSFTADRAAAERALDAIAGAIDGKPLPAAATAGPSDPLRLTGLGAARILAETWPIEERDIGAETIGELATGPAANLGNFKDGFLQWNAINHARILQAPNLAERMRGHVRAMGETFGQLAATLRGVQGRKYLAFFSEGFPSDLLGSGLVASGTPSGGGTHLAAFLQRNLEELRRAGWVLHAVNLNGARVGPRAGDSLFFLAHETGGKLVQGEGDLAAGLGRALLPSTHVYLLSVQVEGLQSNGAFHGLDVKVRGAARGTEVRHRAGYHAPLPFEKRPPVQRLADAATLIAGGEPRDELGVSVVAAPLRAGGDSTRVGVVVEVPAAALLASPSAHGGLEVYGYAVDAGGRSSDFFSYAVDVNGQQLGARIGEGGVRFVATVDLPPRQHELRLLVRERASGHYSLVSTPIDLQPAGSSSPELAALFLPTLPDPWLVVRDPGAEGFSLHGRGLAPAVRPAVEAAGDSQVLLVGRGLAEGGAALRTRIFDRSGKQVGGGQLEVLSLTAGAGGEPDLAVARLHTGGMAAGEYRLEVVLAAGGRVELFPDGALTSHGRIALLPPGTRRR